MAQCPQLAVAEPVAYAVPVQAHPVAGRRPGGEPGRDLARDGRAEGEGAAVPRRRAGRERRGGNAVRRRGGVAWARTAHLTPYGRAEVSWRRADGNLTVDVAVPAGATADDPVWRPPFVPADFE
jgi:hypothetical protein